MFIECSISTLDQPQITDLELIRSDLYNLILLALMPCPTVAGQGSYTSDAVICARKR